MSEDKTFGEKLAGVSFNPSADPDVTAIKEAAATLFDLINDIAEKTDDPVKQDMVKSSLMDGLSCQMKAVKAVTWNK